MVNGWLRLRFAATTIASTAAKRARFARRLH